MSEADASEMVNKHFVPKYAASVQRCPCEGSCIAAITGTRRSGAACGVTGAHH